MGKGSEHQRQSPVLTDLEHYTPEVRELAKRLILRHGERAATYAIHQSFRAGHRGEQRTMETWLSIGDAVAEIWRVEPIAGRLAHPHRKEALMGDQIERKLHSPGWMRSEVHVSTRNPMLFVIVVLTLALVSFYVEGVSEGWWN